ncbi:MAG: hypothetical protein EA397_06215 [Deltaproteobacteria bacterium]|nr:MAG: hypothetical protein EA397_06215 [Deltaproteobacteria bacterium]
MISRWIPLFLLACVRGSVPNGLVPPPTPAHWQDEAEQWMDDGGLVDLGDPADLPAGWRPELSVQGRRELAETGPGQGAWSQCVDPRGIEGLSWERACRQVAGGHSSPDLSRRRAIEYAHPDCTGPSRAFPDGRPDPHRVPQGLRGGLILRCESVTGIADSGE